jgi:23S rRNA pseudouridine955/2504/2580 synthase
MNNVMYYTISSEEEGQRIDNYLLRILKGVPRSMIYRIIRSGEVRINKKRAQASTRLQGGDIIRVPPLRMSPEKQFTVSPGVDKKLSQNIIYEDDCLLVINKPAGMAVHGGSGVSLGVIEALRKMRPELSYLELVHRLDRETSGCLLLTKRRSTLRALHALLEKREISKTYWAILVNRWEGKRTAYVDVALEKNTLKSGERMVIVKEDGKASRTTFNLLENFAHCCLVESLPKTGRTHQIRVHGAHLQHPILGDEKYGGDKSSIKIPGKQRNLYLHAYALQFTLGDKQYNFTADLDDRFQQTLDHLRETADA